MDASKSLPSSCPHDISLSLNIVPQDVLHHILQNYCRHYSILTGRVCCLWNNINKPTNNVNNNKNGDGKVDRDNWNACINLFVSNGHIRLLQRPFETAQDYKSPSWDVFVVIVGLLLQKLQP